MKAGRPRTRPRPGTEAWRDLQRHRMADIRARKRFERECRQCPKPAHVDPETGRVYDSCKKHLDADRKRVGARKKAKPT